MSFLTVSGVTLSRANNTLFPAPKITPLLPRAPLAQPGSDVLFVTWIAFGDFGDGGMKTHNFHRVDMRFESPSSASQ